MPEKPSTAYVEQRHGVYWVTGTRVSLDSLVYLFLEGRSPESITQSFPALTLEQVYGALTYYLAHRLEIDSYLAEQEARSDAAREQSHATHHALVERLRSVREHRQPATS